MCLHYKPLVDQYLNRTVRPLSTYHFSSIFAWSDFFTFEFPIIDDHLCIFAFQGKDSFLYLPPLGEDLSQKVIKECFKRMGKRPIARIENILENQLPGLKAGGYNHYLKAHEYVYHNAHLQKLSGHAYKSKRHDVHLFLKHYTKAIFRPYTSEDLSACQALYTFWVSQKCITHNDPVYVQMLQENAGVHAKLIEHASVLGLVGRVVEIDKKIVGYTFGYKQNDATFCVALEIVDLNKKGLAAYIFNAFCNDAQVKDYPWINTMDDFGLPNIARTKESYHPAQKIAVYNIKE